MRLTNLTNAKAAVTANQKLVAQDAVKLAAAKTTLANAQAALKVAQANGQESITATYVQGADGFPEKFYNYWDALRLWKLVNENRATSLQEAFNLLETQHFQEDQLSMQAEMNRLQADIATNSKIAAVASTVTAFNTRRK